MRKSFIMLSAAAIMAAASGQAMAVTMEDLQKQISDLTNEVATLKQAPAKETAQKEAAAKESPVVETVKKAMEKTKIGGYGELAFISKKENGNRKGGNYFDPQRIVLYVDSQLNDWISFNSELEWEHGGSDGGADGGVAVEQAFLDFKLHPAFNVKAGAMLVPLGAVNLYHEPTNFNSTERPQLDRYLIPATWQEMGIAVHGNIGSKANYQVMLSPGLDGNGFSAEKGLREGRQNFGKDSNRNLAVSGRLEVNPLTNLYTNFSFYTGNSAKTGDAYTTIAAFDGKYSIGDFDLMGEYVQIFQSNPDILTPDPADHAIGRRMSGYWVEGAYRFLPKSLKTGKLSDADATIFVRYSEFDTLGGRSSAAGSFERSYTTTGIAFKPTSTVVVKADYQFYNDKRPAAEKLDNDKVELMFGFVF